MTDNSSSSVGYKKPPAKSRFKPGQSGNPKGRPKGSRNFQTDLMEELAERVMLTENGERKVIMKQRALIKSVLNKALEGDVRAFATIANLLTKVELASEQPQEKDFQLSATEVIDRLIERHLEQRGIKK